MQKTFQNLFFQVIMNLIGKTLDELYALTTQYNMAKYVAKQLSYWMYNAGADSYEVMHNISKANRGLLARDYEIKIKKPLEVRISTDGTRKYLFETENGNFVETAYIPDHQRHTLCISSEAGCKMACSFCSTGEQGFQEKLSTYDIVNQLNAIPERNLVTNIVFMGMGEPLDNIENVTKAIEIFSEEYGFKIGKKKITLSTIGMLPQLTTFLRTCTCNVAISLHSPFDDERSMLMPCNKTYPIGEVINVLRNHDWGKRSFPSFEYIMFDGINDTDRHIKGICKLLNGMRCLINLISYHNVPGQAFKASPTERIIAFRDALSDKGFPTTIRSSRGFDIEAACGLLSTKRMLERLF